MKRGAVEEKCSNRWMRKEGAGRRSRQASSIVGPLRQAVAAPACAMASSARPWPPSRVPRPRPAPDRPWPEPPVRSRARPRYSASDLARTKRKRREAVARRPRPLLPAALSASVAPGEAPRARPLADGGQQPWTSTAWRVARPAATPRAWRGSPRPPMAEAALVVASLWSARCGARHGAALTGLPWRCATAAAPSRRGGGAQRRRCKAGYLKRSARH
ncbi:hypothetical protein VPH35_058497 [Triticum aestivum]